MPSKDIKKITLVKHVRAGTYYVILTMDGMVDLRIGGGDQTTRVVSVGDELSVEEAGWLADQWVVNEQDDNRNLTQYMLRVKQG